MKKAIVLGSVCFMMIGAAWARPGGRPPARSQQRGPSSQPRADGRAVAAGGWRLPSIPGDRCARSIVRLQLHTIAFRRQHRIVLAPMVDRRPICIVTVVVSRHMNTTVTVGMKAYGMMHMDIHITLQPPLLRQHLLW